MKYKNRQAFTITELVIVIAVIAILAAVMIPTFVSLVEKANLSSDIQAVRQMNMALAVGSVEKVPEDYGAASKILRDAGYAVDDGLYPVSKNLRFLWHLDQNMVSLTKVIDTEGAETVELIFPEPAEYEHLKFADYTAYTNALGTDVYDLAYPNSGTPVVPVEGVTISSGTLTLNVGGTTTLAVDIAPKNATNTAVTWSSSNNAVTTVDANGLVTAVGGGTATITVTTADGGFSAACEVTVEIPATKIQMSTDKLLMIYTKDRPDDPHVQTLSVKLFPDRTTDEIIKIVWESGDDDYVSVDDYGNVTAKNASPDEIKITAKVTTKANKTFTGTCLVTVRSAKLDSSDVPEKLRTGDECTIPLSFTLNEKISITKVVWSGDDKVTCISSDSTNSKKPKAVVRADAVGNSTVKATITFQDTEKNLTCERTYTFPITVDRPEKDKLLDALSTGSAVNFYKLTEDVDLSDHGDVSFEKEFTLDLDGNTLTLQTGHLLGINIKSNQGVTIKNGYIETNTTSNINVMADGWLILDKVTVIKKNGGACALVNKGTCFITGCTFINESADGDFIYNGVDWDGKPIGKESYMKITSTVFDGVYNSGAAIIWSKSQSMTMLYEGDNSTNVTVKFIGTLASDIPILLCEDGSYAFGSIADKDDNIIYPS